MKKTYTIFFYAVFIIAAIYLIYKIKIVNGFQKRTLVNKVYSSNEYGSLYVNYYWKLPNNTIIVDSESQKGCVQDYQVNKTYIFKTQTLKFNN